MFMETFEFLFPFSGGKKMGNAEEQTGYELWQTEQVLYFNAESELFTWGFNLCYLFSKISNRQVYNFNALRIATFINQSIVAWSTCSSNLTKSYSNV